MKRILVVDDNADAARSLAALLQLKGNETRIAYDGEAAVDEAEAFRPHVVVLDLGLPKLDGFDTCRRIRRQPWAHATRFVALTGWSRDEDQARAREAGFAAHLVKPVELTALLNVLTETK